MRQIQIIVLAAGKGKRMKNKNLPKVLLSIKGKPIIYYLMKAIKKSGICKKPIIIVGQRADLVKKFLGPNYIYVFQKRQLGTGHAVTCTKKYLKRKAKNIMVLYGDHPLIRAETIKKLEKIHKKENKVITLMTTKVSNFQDWRRVLYDFGRIIRNKKGEITDIIELKDASKKQKQIKELNPSLFCFKANWLWQNIKKLKNDNVQKEYYLTDMIKIAFQQGKEIAEIKVQPQEVLGINTFQHLQLASKLL